MTNDLGLVLITDRKTSRTPLIEAVKLAIKGGVNTVQLREKDLDSNALFKLASDIKYVTDKAKIMLVINDRCDIALAIKADGVHIGKKSIPINEVRNIIGKNMLIGYSAHNIKEAEYAQNNGADYISLSPIFHTSSKRNGLKQTPLGPEAIKGVRSIINCPIIALGGINHNNIDNVLENGADSVAVISNILQASDPSLAAKRLSRKIQKHINQETLSDCRCRKDIMKKS